VTPLAATVGHGTTAFWYLTRSTGLVALVLLSATVVLGLVSAVGWASPRWPRFASQGLHRNLSLFCICLVAVHVLTTVADGYVPITVADAFVPFISPYRPIWVGLGALAFDLLLAVAVSSGLRRYIGVGVWRGVHWLAYACWPVAMLHGLGSGSDTRLSVGVFVYLLCAAGVAAALAWRLVSVPSPSAGWRLAAAGAGAAALIVTLLFALEGPLRPGWSHRAGTSSAVLSQLTPATVAPSSTPTTGLPKAGTTGGIPATPFTSSVSGSIASKSVSADQTEVDIGLALPSTTTPLDVQLVGTPQRGGVRMASSTVTFGQDQGTVTALDGSTIDASVSGPGGPLNLVLELDINQAAGTVSGAVTGSSG
jgi:DMSO/TMAO reductase YedYZ heme-binding membrane subunit